MTVIADGKFYVDYDGDRCGPAAYIGDGFYFVPSLKRRWLVNAVGRDTSGSHVMVAEWTDEQPAVSTTLAQDGETHAERAKTAADAETPSTDAGNEKEDGIFVIHKLPKFDDPDVLKFYATKLEAEEAAGMDARYRSLQAILSEAYDQAATGKGRVRHANNKFWLEQPIMTIGRNVGLGYPTGQALKKIQEAVGMVSRGEREAAVAEMLGAIVYAAAAVQLIREGE